MLIIVDDGTVPLTPADLRALSDEDDGNDSPDETLGDEDDGNDSPNETLVDDSESPIHDVPMKMERIILRNTARHQAMQINAALGEDVWKEMDRLVIKDNVAEDQAVQVNHGTTIETFMFLVEHQDRKIAARQKVTRAGHDSVLAHQSTYPKVSR